MGQHVYIQLYINVLFLQNIVLTCKEERNIVKTGTQEEEERKQTEKRCTKSVEDACAILTIYRKHPKNRCSTGKGEQRLRLGRKIKKYKSAQNIYKFE